MRASVRARARKTVIVGDVQGCAFELRALLEKVGFASHDSLVLCGDLLARGPDPDGVLEVMRETRARSVRGNHDRKRDDLPLWIDLPDHGVRVVHAGVVPTMPIERTPPEALMRVRTIDARGCWSEEPDAGKLWGALYEGPPHIVFGHHAMAGLQLHAWATGIDTGCVYGGSLTAVVLGAGEKMPRGEAAGAKLVSVRARRRYYGDEGAPV